MPGTHLLRHDGRVGDSSRAGMHCCCKIRRKPAWLVSYVGYIAEQFSECVVVTTSSDTVTTRNRKQIYTHKCCVLAVGMALQFFFFVFLMSLGPQKIINGLYLIKLSLSKIFILRSVFTSFFVLVVLLTRARSSRLVP